MKTRSSRPNRAAVLEEAFAEAARRRAAEGRQESRPRHRERGCSVASVARFLFGRRKLVSHALILT